MVKQNWKIPSEEKFRILDLHESATKKHYLIQEQQPFIKTETQKTNEFKPVNLGNLFGYGQYKSDNVKNQLNQLRPQILQFMKDNDSPNFTVNITAGESRVTNPSDFSQPGSLALARANSVRDYFNELFPEEIKSGKIKIVSPKDVTEVKIGDTKYYKGSANSKHDKPDERKFYLDHVNDYAAEQFVNFNVVGSGKKTEVEYICNWNEETTGGLADPKKNFVFQEKTFDISKMPVGQKIKFTFLPAQVPDMLTVNAGNKFYTTGFVGVGGKFWSLMLATILGNIYNGNPPSPFPQGIKPIDSKTVLDGYIPDDNLEQLLGHVLKINWKGGWTKQVPRIKWYQYDQPPIKSDTQNPDFDKKYGGSIVVTKEEGMNSLTYRVYSPIGTTIWKLFIRCFK
ncbi:hypothetical protein EBU94_05660 [bacterium]|nr:hypothetical protein [bacterium]